MHFAQNKTIKSINHSCLKIPQPTWHCRQHAWSSKQAQTLPISPHRPSFHLYAGGAPNLVNESSLGRRIQKQTLHLKKDCVWAQIYMQPTQPTSMKLPLCIHIFFQQYFSNANFSFLFPKFCCFNFKEAIAAFDSDLTCCYQNCCFFHETFWNVDIQ